MFARIRSRASCLLWMVLIAVFAATDAPRGYAQNSAPADGLFQQVTLVFNADYHGSAMGSRALTAALGQRLCGNKYCCGVGGAGTMLDGAVTFTFDARWAPRMIRLGTYQLLICERSNHQGQAVPITLGAVRDAYNGAAEIRSYKLQNGAQALSPAEPRSDAAPNNRRSESGNLNLQDNERHIILRALQQTHGDRAAAAKKLGLSERALARKLKEYGLDAASR